MPVAKIRKGAITIPIKTRKEANLEDGAFVSIEYKSVDGVIILKPNVSACKDDQVRLSEKGKIMIEKALDAEKKGEIIGLFSDIQKALRALKEF
ncbi:MAG: AbrB/MazE/SpoVT family DNA-binding domain-containing protein [Candidatus Poribacteria bacterium]